MDCKHGLILETCAYCTGLLKKCTYSSSSNGASIIPVHVFGSIIEETNTKKYRENYIRKNKHIVHKSSCQ
jgi:hypothetical protein